MRILEVAEARRVIHIAVHRADHHRRTQAGDQRRLRRGDGIGLVDDAGAPLPDEPAERGAAGGPGRSATGGARTSPGRPGCGSRLPIIQRSFWIGPSGVKRMRSMVRREGVLELLPIPLVSDQVTEITPRAEQAEVMERDRRLAPHAERAVRGHEDDAQGEGCPRPPARGPVRLRPTVPGDRLRASDGVMSGPPRPCRRGLEAIPG